MNEANVWRDLTGSVEEFWSRLAPLVVLAYQVVALVCLVALGFFAFSWFQQPMVGLMVDPEMVVGNAQQTSLAFQTRHHLAGFTQQGLLVGIDGEIIRNSTEMQQVLSRYSAGAEVQLQLRARSGHITTQPGTLRYFTNNERAVYFLVPNLAAWIFLGAGFWAVRRRLDDPLTRTFAVLTASAALTLGAWFDVWSTHRFLPIWLLAIGIGAGALIRFTVQFPTQLQIDRKYPAISSLGYLIGLVLSLSMIVIWLSDPNPFRLGELWIWLFGFGILSLVVFLATLVYRRFFSTSPVDVEQTKLVLWASGIAFLPVLFSLLAEETGLTNLTIPLMISLPLLAIFPLTTAYTLLRYRIINTGFLVSRVLIYALLTVSAGLGYAALVSGLSLLFHNTVQASHPVLVGGVIFVLALLVNPFRTHVQQMLDRIFVRSEEMFRQYLEGLEKALAQDGELNRISSSIREFIQQHFEPVRLHIYVYDALVDRYVPMAGDDGRPTTDIRFPRNSGLVHRMTSLQTALSLDPGEALPPELVGERARLALLGTQLFVALPGQEQLTGWLALGPRTSTGTYTGYDLGILSRLAEIAAAAYERSQVMADKDRRVHEMNVLTRVAQGVNITVEFDDILELLYAQTTQVVPVDNFNITLQDKETQILRHVFLVHEDDRLTDLESGSIPPGYGLEREVLETRRHLITDDYQQECRNRRLIANKEGLYAWMGVPLNAGAEVIGVISVGSTNPAILYTEDQYNILQAIADQAAGAIVKSRLLNETQTRARQLASLNEVTRGLTSTLELDPLLHDIMDSAVEILNCEAGSLLLLDQDTQELVFEVVVGPVAEQFLGERQKLGVGLAGKVAESMEPMIVNNVEQSPDWDSEPDQETGFLTRGMLVVPMHYKGDVIGVLEVINKKNRTPFSVEDQELLNAFAGQAAVAVENVRLYMQTDQELARRVEELSVMQRIDRELNTTLDTGKAMEITLDWAMRQSDSIAGLVGVVAEDGLRVMASQGYQAELARYEDGIIPLDLPALTNVMAEGRYYLSESGEQTGLILPEAHGQLALPIRRETDVIGVLLLECRQDTHYEDSTIDFLTRLSDHASIAISNAQLYTEVQRANLAKSEFVSFVSHELKTPMTSIRGYADLLAAGSVGPVNEAQNEFLGTIRSNIQRMATLVSDLADISRIEAGRLHLDFSPVVIREVVDEVVRSAQALADEKSQQVALELPEDLPQVWGDRHRLTQVLTNLVSNAIKYTPEGGEIMIRARQADNLWDPDGAPQVLHLAVVDNGIGIKPEDQAKIFQQYFRTEEGKDAASGTGLGLNITRYLVEMQGGKIWFESEFGAGTTFHFTVPLAEVEGD
jgi:signal transduction histidine kinase/putative methionine-R-sulfoxide reductase with GAF domain